MNRAERRKAERNSKKNKSNSTVPILPERVTKSIKRGIDIELQRVKREARDEAVDIAFLLMLALPLEVLIGEGYWEKTAKKRMPKFLDDVLSLYDSWEKGVLTIDDLKRDLWEYGGIKLEGKNEK